MKSFECFLVVIIPRVYPSLWKSFPHNLQILTHYTLFCIYLRPFTVVYFHHLNFHFPIIFSSSSFIFISLMFVLWPLSYFPLLNGHGWYPLVFSKYSPSKVFREGYIVLKKSFSVLMVSLVKVNMVLKSSWCEFLRISPIVQQDFTVSQWSKVVSLDAPSFNGEPLIFSFKFKGNSLFKSQKTCFKWLNPFLHLTLKLLHISNLKGY
jgi:hypothetical protein